MFENSASSLPINNNNVLPQETLKQPLLSMFSRGAKRSVDIDESQTNGVKNSRKRKNVYSVKLIINYQFCIYVLHYDRDYVLILITAVIDHEVSMVIQSVYYIVELD